MRGRKRHTRSKHGWGEPSSCQITSTPSEVIIEDAEWGAYAETQGTAPDSARIVVDYVRGMRPHDVIGLVEQDWILDLIDNNTITEEVSTQSAASSMIRFNAFTFAEFVSPFRRPKPHQVIPGLSFTYYLYVLLYG